MVNPDKRDYGRDRDEHKRDRDSRDSRRRDERGRRDTGRRDGEKDRDPYGKDKRGGDKGSRDAEREPEKNGERNTWTEDSGPRETRKPSQPQGMCVYVSRLYSPLTDRYGPIRFVRIFHYQHHPLPRRYFKRRLMRGKLKKVKPWML
jgi:hypothetical protein